MIIKSIYSLLQLICLKLMQDFSVNLPGGVSLRAALISEMWRGKCRHVHSAALIGIGTRLRSALLMDGKIIRGVNNAAGEIGYMLFERNHLNQNWKNKGCFES